MSRTTLGFIFTGLVYLVVGITLGVVFFIAPDTLRLRTVHVHANLVGFVIFLIIGVGYHILPRFRGRPLHSEGLAWSGFWMANIGLAGLLLVNALIAYNVLQNATYLQVVFGGLLVLSIYLFIYNMFMTLAVPAKK